MKTVIIKIDLEKWPEAMGWAFNGYHIGVDKLIPYKPNFNRFGKGPEEPQPIEYIWLMMKLMPRYFTKLVNQLEGESDKVEHPLSQDLLNEWLEEALQGALSTLVINFAMEHGLTDPVITQEYIYSLSEVVPITPTLDVDQINFLMGLVREHGLGSHVMESIAYILDREEEEESGDPANLILKSSREFIQKLISKLQRIKDHSNK